MPLKLLKKLLHTRRPRVFALFGVIKAVRIHFHQSIVTTDFTEAI